MGKHPPVRLLEVALGILYVASIHLCSALLAFDRGNGHTGAAEGRLILDALAAAGAGLYFYHQRITSTAVPPTPCNPPNGSWEVIESQVGLFLIRFAIVTIALDACWMFSMVLCVGNDISCIILLQNHNWMSSIVIAPASAAVDGIAASFGIWARDLLLPAAALQFLVVWWVAVQLARRLPRVPSQRIADFRSALQLLRHLATSIPDFRRIPSGPWCIFPAVISGIGPAWLIMHTSFEFHPILVLFLAAASVPPAIVSAQLVGDARAVWACLWNTQVNLLPWSGVLRRISALLVLTYFAVLAGPVVGLQIKMAQCRRFCDRLNPLLAAVEQYHAKYSCYPTSLLAMDRSEELIRQAGVSVREGKFVGSDGICMEYLDEADATIYLRADVYQCNVLIRSEARSLSSSYDVFMRIPREPTWLRHSIWVSRFWHPR